MYLNEEEIKVIQFALEEYRDSRVAAISTIDDANIVNECVSELKHINKVYCETFNKFGVFQWTEEFENDH